MKVSELTGTELDYWVALARGIPVYEMGENWPGNHHINTEQSERPIIIRNMRGDLFIEFLGEAEQYSPSTMWQLGGPIIERERIGIQPDCGKWDAYFNANNGYDGMYANPAHACAYDAPTPLIAAMRAYVASKYGNEVLSQNSDG